MGQGAVVVLLAAALGVFGCSKKKHFDEPVEPELDDQVPKRVITLTPSATRLVIAANAIDRLVATDKFSDRPASVKALPKVGDFLAPNVEAIAKLEPDLVVCDDVQAKARESLRGLGVRVLSIKMHSVADIRRELGAVADALGETGSGIIARRLLEKAVDQARARGEARSKRPRVLWVMDRQPGDLADIVAAGPGSFAAELLEIVGAENAIAGVVRYPKLSREALLKIRAEVVIDASGAAADSMDVWSGNPAWRAVRAPTELATPGPGLAEALAEVEWLVFRTTR